MVTADKITDINLWIGEDGVTFIEEGVLINKEGAVKAFIRIPEYVENVTVLGPEGRLHHDIIPDGKYNLVEYKFKRPLAKGEEMKIWVKFSTPLLTMKTGSNWAISYYTPTSARATIMRVNFPLGSKIISLEPDNLLRSYDKYALILFPQTDEIEFKVLYEYGSTSIPTTTLSPVVNETPVNMTSSVEPMIVLDENTVILIAGILIGIIILFTYTVLRKKGYLGSDKSVGKIEYVPPEDYISKEPSGGQLSYNMNGIHKGSSGGTKVKDSILKMLDDKELAIVKLLEKANEEITQAYIYKTTGIPKTSLSDIIRRIEKRNIIESNKQGRTKWIKLKDWVFD
ncbi:helix-turn-helix transcriptional regulator [Candidatus Altiarchaeota archaeon]